MLSREIIDRSLENFVRAHAAMRAATWSDQVEVVAIGGERAFAPLRAPAPPSDFNPMRKPSFATRGTPSAATAAARSGITCHPRRAARRRTAGASHRGDALVAEPTAMPSDCFDSTRTAGAPKLLLSLSHISFNDASPTSTSTTTPTLRQPNIRGDALRADDDHAAALLAIRAAALVLSNGSVEVPTGDPRRCARHHRLDVMQILWAAVDAVVLAIFAVALVLRRCVVNTSMMSNKTTRLQVIGTILLCFVPWGADSAVQVTGGPALSITTNSAIAGTVSVAANFPCWFTGSAAITTAIAVTDCKAAGTAIAFGSASTAVCGATTGAAFSIQWNVVATGSTYISIIECSGAGTGVGAAEQVVVTTIPTQMGWGSATPTTDLTDVSPTAIVVVVTPSVPIVAGDSLVLTASAEIWVDASVEAAVCTCRRRGAGSITVTSATVSRAALNVPQLSGSGTSSPTNAPSNGVGASASPSAAPSTAPTSAPSPTPTKHNVITIVMGASSLADLPLTYTCTGGLAPNGLGGSSVAFTAVSTGDLAPIYAQSAYTTVGFYYATLLSIAPQAAAASGAIAIYTTGASTLDLVVEFESSLVCATENCGARVHSGTSCADVASQGNHYLNVDGTDAWAGMKMKLLHTDATVNRSTYTLGITKGNAAVLGKVVVVHNDNGARIACGVLGAAMTSTRKFHANLAAETTALGGVEVYTSTSAASLSLVITLSSGVECTSNDCSAHVSSGDACTNSTTQGGRLLNADDSTDAWAGTQMQYLHSDRAASTSTYTLDVARGNVDISGKPVMVFTASGANVACGVLLPRVHSGAPLTLVSALSVSSIISSATTQVTVTGRNFVKFGLPLIKVVSSPCGGEDASDALPGTSAGQLVAFDPPSDTFATFTFAFSSTGTGATLANNVCWKGIGSASYVALASSENSISIIDPQCDAFDNFTAHGHGVATFTLARTWPDSSVALSCKMGYTFTGDALRTCNGAVSGVSASWSAGSAPLCARISCPSFDTDNWMGIGVAVDASKLRSVFEPSRFVDQNAIVFGDQLAFVCSDSLAQLDGPIAPTCIVGGVWKPLPSASNQISCNCPIGKYLAATGMCVDCARNTFAAQVGTLVCKACKTAEGETSPPGSPSCTVAALECPDRTYRDAAKTSCIACPKDGAICEENELTLLDSWWFDTVALEVKGVEISSETEMFPCLNPLSCIVDQMNRTVSCSDGYSSVLCGACVIERRFIRSGQLCRECGTFFSNALFVAAMVIGASFYVVYVVAFQDFSSTEGDQRPIVIKIMMSFCQMLTVLGVFKARGTALFNELVQRPASIVGGGFSSALPIKCLQNSQIYGSFLLNMATPFLAACLTAVVIGPIWICKRASESMRASRPPRRAPNEKIKALCCCRRTKMEEWERNTWLAVRVKKDRSVFKPVPRFIAVIVFVLFGVYPTLVKSIFAIFRCSEPISGLRFLEDDYTVVCWIGWHPRFVALAIVCGVVYLVGIPLGLATILHSNRHRLNEAGFRSTFGFVYSGYHTDRGLVVAWESFVMLRKLAVTAITVSSSDPYIQIFIALFLLIISYGMQERMMPFESQFLNNVEGMGLFSLIFTQIVSILYLYIDTRSAKTGEKDVFLELVVTVVLVMANVLIVVAMVGSYVVAWKRHMKQANKAFEKFIEERDEPFGVLTKYANPYVEPKARLEVFRTLRDCFVYTKPFFGAEQTGEIAEKGDTVLIDECVREYVRDGCRKGREVSWMKLADGTGWMLNVDLRTGDPILELAGHRDNDGSIQQTFWRFSVVATQPVPIRAGTSSAPFVWPTGEFLLPGDSVLVDLRFLRTYGWCCARKTVTFLHLADRRGWIVEPSRAPDTDCISKPDFVDESVLVRLVAQEKHNGALNRVGICEYEAVEAMSFYKHDTWPLGKPIGSIDPHTFFLVESRRTVFTRLRFANLDVLGYQFTICWPRSFRVFRRVGRFATFLKLASRKGYVLTNCRLTGESTANLKSLRLDSVNALGQRTLRWRYHISHGAHAPLQVYARPYTAAVPKEVTEQQTAVFASLAPGSDVIICEMRAVKPKGMFTSEIIVGKIAGKGGGWVAIDPVASLSLVEALIETPESTPQSSGAPEKLNVVDNPMQRLRRTKAEDDTHSGESTVVDVVQIAEERKALTALRQKQKAKVRVQQWKRKVAKALRQTKANEAEAAAMVDAQIATAARRRNKAARLDRKIEAAAKHEV